MQLTSSHWGAFRARAADGAIGAVAPFERDPDPSPLLGGVAESYDHPTRLRRPAVRKSWLEDGPGASGAGRGAEPFVEVSWEKAYDLVAGELDRVRGAFGGDAIFGGSYGWSSAGRFHHAKTQLKRFLNVGGGFVDQVNNYSYGAGMVLLPHVLGDNRLLYGPSTSWNSLAENTELLVAFGGMPSRNAQVESGGCGEHVYRRWRDRLTERGTRLLNISPLRDDLAGEAEVEWWPIVPGTDTALMLALTWTLLEEGLCDRAFVETYCTGFDRYGEYLRTGRSGEPFSAEWAAGVCGVDADKIRDLARALARRRSFIALSWSLQRADRGEQTYWAAIALAAAIGQIGLPGGGVGFGYGSVNGTGNPVRKFKAPSLPTGKNAVRTAIPVARIADLLSRPGERIDYNGEEIVLPDTKLVYWCGGNPFHHHQDLNNLARVWQRPETIVVHEIWWTATARRADIVLPATSTLERNDLGASSSDRFLIAMKRIAPPFAEARDDHRIFADLADRLGVRAAFTEDLSEMGWLERLYETSRRSSASMGNVMPSFAEFWEAGYFEYPELETGIDSLAAFRDDPSGRPLSTPSGRIEVVSERIESFGYADCPGHPVWIEPREWLNGPGADRHPLHLISNQPRTRLHSQLDAVGPSRDSKIQGREPLRMHPEDAAARGLVAGAVVRVFNDRGACLAGLGLSEDVRPGVVQLSTGAWFDPIDPADPFLDSHGNPNVLTHDHGTSALSQGPAAHSCLVEVEAFDGPLPPITVAGPPALLSEAP